MRVGRLALGAILLAATAVDGQGVDVTALTAVLEGEERIRVHLGSRRVQLDRYELRGGGIAYRDRNSNDILVAYESVDRIDVRRSAWRTGLIVGSIYGAAQTALAVAFIRGSDGSTGKGEAYALAAGIGVGAAALGALVGSAFGRWAGAYERGVDLTGLSATIQRATGSGLVLTLSLSP